MNIEHQIFQRQILSQIGIDCWVRKDTEGFDVVDINECEFTTESNLDHTKKTLQFELNENKVISNIPEESSLCQLTENGCKNSNHSKNKQILQSSPIDVKHEQIDLNVDLVNSKQSINKKQNEIQENVTELEKKIAKLDPSNKIDPFQLQAIHYKNWLLIVDNQELNKNEGQVEIWNNICRVLSHKIETLSFPLITDGNVIAMSSEPMDTVELANATLAGFIFRVAKTDKVKLGCLTNIKKGLADDRLKSVPSLYDMLDQPLLKRELWLLLNQ